MRLRTPRLGKLHLAKSPGGVWTVQDHLGRMWLGSFAYACSYAAQRYRDACMMASMFEEATALMASEPDQVRH